jgi:hypothetical protein
MELQHYTSFYVRNGEKFMNMHESSLRNKSSLKVLFRLNLHILKRTVRKIWPALFLLPLGQIMPSRNSEDLITVYAFIFIVTVALLVSFKVSLSVLKSEIPIVKLDDSSMVTMEYRDATVRINLMRLSLPKELKDFSVVILDRSHYVAISKADYSLISNRIQPVSLSLDLMKKAVA